MLLHDSFDYSAREHGDTLFAVEGERELRYDAARDEIHRLANAIVAAGIERGGRVAILAKNRIEYALLYYACSKAGAVPVPLNYRLAPPEWEFILNDSCAQLLWVEPEFAEDIDGVRDGLEHVKRFVLFDGNGERQGYERYEDFVSAQPTSAPEREIAEGDDVYQMYTSGTTGRPKGAVITHAAVTAQLHQAVFGFGSSVGERALIVAPIYHAAASVTAFCTVQSAGTLVIHADFDPAAVVRALSEERIAIALLVPAMIQFLLVGVPDVAERRYDDLRMIVYGASPIAEQTLQRAIDVFGCDFLQGYGMTETTAAATYLMPADHRRALAGEPGLLLSAGRSLLGTEVRIVDAQDRELPSGEIGEVVIRGPQVMRGYWRRPEANEEALRGGWMHTGDAGTMDDEGFVYIQDRVKDMVVSGGENVYPREIEEALYQHPAIAEAAVIGIPDEKFGEAIKAIVVLKPGESAEADELIAFCRERLAGYKTPRSIDFIDALPRNPSGKVLKKELRAPYWEGRGRQVG